jgi:phosphoglycerate dehydrogenase-like enzyme
MAAITSMMKRIPLYRDLQNQQQWKGFATVADGFLSEVGPARGPVVVTDALVEALVQQRIRAAVDVTDPEPLPAGHPLWSAPNCLITPHIGGSTPEFIYRAFRFGAAQVRRFIAGQPLENIVTDAGY